MSTLVRETSSVARQDYLSPPNRENRYQETPPSRVLSRIEATIHSIFTHWTPTPAQLVPKPAFPDAIRIDHSTLSREEYESFQIGRLVLNPDGRPLIQPARVPATITRPVGSITYRITPTATPLHTNLFDLFEPQ